MIIDFSKGNENKTLRINSNLKTFLFLQAIKAKGGDFLEAPASGGKKHAEDGQLVVIAAGHMVLFKLVQFSCNYITI